MISDTDVSAATAQARVWGIIRGPWQYAALLAFVRLGCPDVLASGQAGTAALAENCNADPQALGRVLRCCAALGIITLVPEGGGWQLTPAGHTLTAGGPMRAAVLSAAAEPAWQAMLHLDQAARSGRPVFPDQAGADITAWRESSTQATEVFQQFMTDRSAPAGRAAAGLDYDDACTVADIGGGHGTILAAILDAHPHLSGILLDRPDVLPGAKACLAARGLNGRYTPLGGSYFDPDLIPPADVYLLGNILHNHTDAEAQAILGNLRAANPDARILLIEIILPDDPRTPGMGTDLDMRRLAMGGRERTRAEWEELLGSAGLDITRTLPTASPVTIIDTRPATGRDTR